MRQCRVLLLAAEASSHALEWQRVLHEISGHCLLASMHPAPLAATGLPVRRLASARHPKPLRLAVAAKRLAHCLRRERYNIAIAYYLTSYGVLASLVLPRHYVAVAAGSDLFPQRWDLLRRALSRRALRSACGFFAWTEQMAEAARRCGLAEDSPILVGPRGIDLECFYPRPEPGPPGVLRIVTASRLCGVFLHPVLLKAVAALRDEHQIAVRLDILGDGSGRRRLERMASELGLDGTVRFHGWLPKDAVAQHLREADIFVSLSRTHGLCTAVVEALACGLFPVVSDSPANRPLVRHELNGLCVDGDNTTAVRLALLRACQDADLRERARRINLDLTRTHYDIRRNALRFLETARKWLDRHFRTNDLPGNIRINGAEPNL